MKKQYVILSIFFSLVYHDNLFGQNSIQELGKKIFLAFNLDSLDQINTLRLRADEIGKFWISEGIDTNTNKFNTYLSKYPEITSKLLKKCKLIQSDTLENLISWRNAELDSVKIAVDNLNSSFLGLIKVKSNGNIITLLFEAIRLKGEIWKLGNSIYISSSSTIKRPED